MGDGAGPLWIEALARWHGEIVACALVPLGAEVVFGRDFRVGSIVGTLVVAGRREGVSRVRVHPRFGLGRVVSGAASGGRANVPHGAHHEVALADEGDTVTLHEEALSLAIDVTIVRAERTRREVAPPWLLVASAVAYLLVLAPVLHATTALGIGTDEPMAREDILTMRRMLEAHAEPEEIRPRILTIVPSDEAGTKGAIRRGASLVADDAGRARPRAGTPRAHDRPLRDDGANMHPSPRDLFSSFSVESAGSAWDRPDRAGSDEARALFGRADAVWRGLEDYGFVGAENEGDGKGLPLARIGTLGTSWGSASSIGCGCGGFVPARAHAVRSPGVLAELPLDVDGALPREAIQRVVRASHGRFRACYEPALLRDPSLAGRATVRFVIGRDGRVTTAEDGGSDMPSDVTRCVVRAMTSLAFPEPGGRVVTVVYPFSFDPGA